MTITSFAPDAVEDRIETTAGAATEVTVRVQTNLVAQVERRLLNWLCRQMPASVSPDHLTAIGFGGAALSGFGYWATAWRREFVFVACLGLFLQWFGDSLDGSLARHRGADRPKIGYFIDSSVDCLSMVVIMVGVGASYYASMEAALFALVGYLLMTVHVFLRTIVTGRHQLSFVSCGPTEIRMALIIFSLMVYAFDLKEIDVAGIEIRPFSLALFLFAGVIAIVFCVDTFKTASLLIDQEREADGR